MKLCIMSDTHCRRTGIVVPKCDALLHCGDFSMSGTTDEIVAFNTWLGKQTATHKLVIAGNHDKLFESNPERAKSLLTNATYLKDSGVTIGGLKFWGSPYTPTFFQWSFMKNRGDDIRAKWDLIPPDMTGGVLITHGPPFGILDYSEYGKMRAGCEDLLEVVQRIKPAIHCFGHLHTSYGMVERGGTVFLNAAILNDRYKIARQPWVVDIDPATKIVAVESPWRERG